MFEAKKYWKVVCKGAKVPKRFVGTRKSRKKYYLKRKKSKSKSSLLKN